MNGSYMFLFRLSQVVSETESEFLIDVRRDFIKTRDEGVF